ncbi:hypothetical protein [Streptomyces sp. NEAU-YJ-81]|uniref:hypothetical protein n=1 Tax=Streptomyces sp. NEAU-YJ-81 TaxID=2820288 RepID=UPI001ABD47CD|nr:hypothetical protein [Streptomyces sp. NEAU-YJ-81]MBO3673980.1 hypothetical protein [Streptomyces sp. NEAU-YJ-81]
MATFLIGEHPAPGVRHDDPIVGEQDAADGFEVARLWETLQDLSVGERNGGVPQHGDYSVLQSFPGRSRGGSVC